METNILGTRIPFSSAVSFGEISNSARRRGLGRNAGFSSCYDIS